MNQKSDNEKLEKVKIKSNMNLFIYGRQNGKFAGGKKKRRISKKNK